MITEASMPSAGSLRRLVYAQLPAGASPLDTAAQPLHRHVLDRAQGDVLDMTRERMSESFGKTPHVVVVIRDGDLDTEQDADVARLLEQTEGGAVVFGVAYTLDESPTRQGDPMSRSGGDLPAARAVRDEACPECGTSDAKEIQRAAEPDEHGTTTRLVECCECGTVWDSVAP